MKLFSPVSTGDQFKGIFKMDPRVKVVAIFSYVFIASTLTATAYQSAALVFLFVIAGFSRLSPVRLLKRMAWVIPFGGVLILIFPFITPGPPVFVLNAGPITLVASDTGVTLATMLFLRVACAVTALYILTATTGFRVLMDTFKQLKAPDIMVTLVEFTWRYAFVLAGETRRMLAASRARGFDGCGSLFNRHVTKTIGQLVGVLFIRSWERGERVYSAMLARGFSGPAGAVSVQSPCLRDVCAGAGIMFFAMGLRLGEYGGLIWQISSR